MKLSFHDHGKQMLKRLFLFLNNLVGGGEKMSLMKKKCLCSAILEIIPSV